MRLRFAGLLIPLILTVAVPRAQARQVLVVSNVSGSVGQYSATTGATINATFLPGGSFGAHELASDGHNHLFVSNPNNGIVGEVDATTGDGLISINTYPLGIFSPFGLAVDTKTRAHPTRAYFVV